MNITSNYHSHSVFDKHATETVEEVILEAIKFGFKEWGFTGHIPLPSDKVGDNRMLNTGEVREYIKEVLRIKEKYRDQINVLCGIEADVIDWRDRSIQMRSTHEEIEALDGVDYVIVGHHCLPDGNTKEEWQSYIDRLEEFINYSKKFKYLGHPDIFMNKFPKETEMSKWVSDKIIGLSIKYDFPLGVNLLGLYEKKSYPSKIFFKRVAKAGAKTIFEMDNHFKEQWIQKTFDDGFAFAKETGINPINWNKKTL